MYSPLSDLDPGRNWTLVELSGKKALTLIPSVVYLAVLMIIGIVGNSIVIAVYYRRFSPSTHRSFILVLASYDFFACAVGAPFCIAESFHAFTYFEFVSCKIFRFVLYYTCIASSLTLVLIAYERFKKICTPLKPQMSVPQAKKALFLVAGVISSISASPSLIMYGNATIQTGAGNLNGTKCFISDSYAETIWPTMFNVYLLALAILSTLIMAVCYIAIARQVSKMGKDKIAKRINQSTPGMPSGVANSIGNISDMDEFDSDAPSRDNVSTDQTTETNGKSNVIRNSSITCDTKHSVRPNIKRRTHIWAGKVIRRLSSRSGKKTLRVTKMLTLVTVAFVVSYLPHLTLMLWGMLVPEDKEDTLPTDNVYQVLFYSFLLNNLVNPFIYATMDFKFREEAIKLIKCKS